MKQQVLALFALLCAANVNAQSIYYTDAGNKDILRHTNVNDAHRREIILPRVNGYQVLKADLHTHTVYSDASVTPEFRANEAWLDGLDVLAITDHVEYRRWEGQMVSFLKGYMPQGTEAANTNIMTNAADERGIISDLNVPYNAAKWTADNHGLVLIPGAEITRDPHTVGHYNALFIKDANTIYNPDPIESMKKARAQGGIIMQNHPGWLRKNVDIIEFEQKVYEQKLISGVEIMNDMEFYPPLIDRAHNMKLFMAANTDIHSSTDHDYNTVGQMRNMTFILSKDKSLASVKEALLAGRTLAFAAGSIAGEAAIVRDFFNACIQYETLSQPSDTERRVRMSNPTSLTFYLSFGGNMVLLRPFSSRDYTVNRNSETRFTVLNLWIPGEKPHPEFSIAYHKLAKPN